MFTFEITPNEAGVVLYGQYEELHFFYSSIHKLAEMFDVDDEKTKGINLLLMTLAYDVRHAYMGNYETKEITTAYGNQKIQVYGFPLLWSDHIVFIQTLNYAFNHSKQKDKGIQGIICFYEHTIQEAMKLYDPNGARKLIRSIDTEFTMHVKYSFILYLYLHNKFYEAGNGRRRYLKLLPLIRQLFTPTSNQLQLIRKIETTAKGLGVRAVDLSLDNPSDILW